MYFVNYVNYYVNYHDPCIQHTQSCNKNWINVVEVQKKKHCSVYDIRRLEIL